MIWNGERTKSIPMALIQRLAAVVKHLIASCLYTSIPPKYLAEIKTNAVLSCVSRTIQGPLGFPTWTRPNSPPMLWRASLMAKSKQNKFVAALCSFSSILGAETGSSRITSRLMLLLDLKTCGIRVSRKLRARKKGDSLFARLEVSRVWDVSRI